MKGGTVIKEKKYGKHMRRGGGEERKFQISPFNLDDCSDDHV